MCIAKHKYSNVGLSKKEANVSISKIGWQLHSVHQIGAIQDKRQDNIMQGAPKLRLARCGAQAKSNDEAGKRPECLRPKRQGFLWASVVDQQVVLFVLTVVM